jgi:signal transduction histidine kinase
MMTRAPRLSLSIKVGLILFAVVAGALALVYVAVVPRLESQLVDAKVDELESAAPGVARELGDQPDLVRLQDRVEDLAQALNLRIAVFNRLSEEQLYTVADSTQNFSGAISRDPVAVAAARENRLERGQVTRAETEFGEVAVPIAKTDAVVLLSGSLQDVLSNVRTVKKSLIAAGIASLAVSWLAGYLIAWGFTRRIRRLEGAAERLAAGNFETPVVDSGRDEVGQLADAFDGMRLRLAALDRARSEFIANASHELRTPLFSLGGFLELLSGGDLEDDVRRDFLAEMRGQIERLTRLATDLLDLSRLDAGHLEVEREPIDLAECARVVGEEFRAIAEAGGRKLEVDADRPVDALGDELRVQQIGRALVENALRHTPAGTHVNLAAGVRDGRAYLAVRDDGPGVPAEDQGHLFERFYRAGGGKASGSGLGLAIASELAARMAGSLEVDSRPGRTVFTLLLAASDRGTSRENGSSQEQLSVPSLP